MQKCYHIMQKVRSEADADGLLRFPLTIKATFAVSLAFVAFILTLSHQQAVTI